MKKATISLKIKIGIVEYDFKKIIKEWIKKECRSEAEEIIGLILRWDTRYTYTLLVEFIIYHENKMGNQVCSQLDFMKYKLVDHGRMKHEGCFGAPFIDVDIHDYEK